jgi:hypothetical protein
MPALLAEHDDRRMETTMMTGRTKRAPLAAAAVAALLSALPLGVDPSGGRDGAWVTASSAFAKDGRSDRDDGGRGGDDDSGGDDHGGRGGDDDNSGPGRGGDDHGGHGGDDDNSGPGNGGDRGDDDGGDGDRRGGDNDRDDDGRRGAHHIDPATGAKIEVEGGNIEIVYPNGWKEELENGRYELRDPSGRTVVERPATAEDIARLQALAG